MPRGRHKKGFVEPEVEINDIPYEVEDEEEIEEEQDDTEEKELDFEEHHFTNEFSNGYDDE